MKGLQYWTIWEVYSIFTWYLNDKALAKVIDSNIFRGYRDQYINTIDSNQNAGELGKFWLTFIDMATILFSTINATQKGNCDEFPRAYETWFHWHLRMIENLLCKVFDSYCYWNNRSWVYIFRYISRIPDRNFSVQFNEGKKFSRIEPDKTIKNDFEQKNQHSRG